MPHDDSPVEHPPGDRPTVRVAVVIPILNEATFLPRTMHSLAAQDYPHDLIEILIVDGGSTDDWKGAVADVALDGIALRTIPNPRRVTPAAVNLALHATDAPAILWISGHCALAPNYLTKCVEAFTRYEDIGAGGRLRIEGRGFAGRLNEFVLKSPIGTGLAPWRFERRETWVDAVNFALYDRQTLIDIGGLDERLVRNQDNDLVKRLTAHGLRYRMVDSDATYLAPATLSGLWRRAWANASWNIWCWKLGIPSSSWYHFAPMAAVALGALLLVLTLYGEVATTVLLSVVAAYLLLIWVHTLYVTIPQGAIWAIPLLPFHIIVFHALYGIGGWVALFRKVPVRPGTTTQTG